MQIIDLFILHLVVYLGLTKSSIHGDRKRFPSPSSEPLVSPKYYPVMRFEGLETKAGRQDMGFGGRFSLLPKNQGGLMRKLRIYVRRAIYIHSLSNRNNKKMVFQHCPSTFRIDGFFNGISAGIFVEFSKSLGIEENTFLL